MGDSLISWKSKKWPTVSLSSTEEEYRAMASTFCEMQWVTNILQELNVQIVQPSLLFCKNASARHIASNSSFHECIKHIDLDYHLACEKLQLVLLHLLTVPSSQQIVDIFTKPLDLKPFSFHLSKLGVCSIYHKLIGGY